MCILKGFGFFFGLGVIYNLFRGDFSNAFWGLVIAATLFFTGGLLGREDSCAEKFEQWLLHHKAALFDGEILVFSGQSIALETKVTRYFVVFSFLIFSAKEKTRYLVRGETKTRLAGFLCSVLTLVFGWWALPEGPISTLWALGKNARGGETVQVAVLLNTLAKTQSKADSA